jgi:hypothetical protein
MARKGILLDTGWNPQVVVVRDTSGRIKSGLVIGDTTMQETAIVLRARPGDIKEDQVLGVGLTRYVRGDVNMPKLDNDIKNQLARIGIAWDEVKDSVKVNINT